MRHAQPPAQSPFEAASESPAQPAAQPAAMAGRHPWRRRSVAPMMNGGDCKREFSGL